MAKALKPCVFTLLTFMVAYLIAPTIITITATEISFCCADLAPVACAGSKPTVPRPLFLFSLLLLFLYVSKGLLTNTDDDDDPYELVSIESELNLFISNDPPLYEEFAPTEHYSNPNGSLTSSDLQEVESTRRDNGEENNLHSETVVLEEVDDLNTWDLPAGLEERVRKYEIDLSALLLADSEKMENMYTEKDLAHEEERMDKHIVSIPSTSVEIENMNDDGRNIQHNLRPEMRRESTDEVVAEKQMDVHETTIDDHSINCSGEITLSDLQQQYGKKINDAAESLGVSRSTFKRSCRANGIARWSRKRMVKQPATKSNIGVKVSYNGVNVIFPLNLPSTKKDLEVEIDKRFGIKTGSYWIKYEDEDKDWILITCDVDLQHGMSTCIERGITRIKMLVGSYIDGLPM